MNSVMCVLGLCDATRRDEAEDANDARARTRRWCAWMIGEDNDDREFVLTARVMRSFRR
jgi:hypothetical protein